MPSAWRPRDYAGEQPFLEPRQYFRTPDRENLPAPYRNNPRRTRASDPSNLPGAVLSWLIARSVDLAIRDMHTSAASVARELGISFDVLDDALDGSAAFKIEDIASLAEFFHPRPILPTQEQVAVWLRKKVTPMNPAERRGRLHGRPRRVPLPPAEARPTRRRAKDGDVQYAPDIEDPLDFFHQAKRVPQYVEDLLAESIAEQMGPFVAHQEGPGHVEIVIESYWNSTDRASRWSVSGGTINGGAVVLVNLFLDRDWERDTVRPLLDGHFITRVLERGGDGPTAVEAVWLVPKRYRAIDGFHVMGLVCDVVDVGGRTTLRPHLSDRLVELLGDDGADAQSQLASFLPR